MPRYVSQNQSQQTGVQPPLACARTGFSVRAWPAVGLRCGGVAPCARPLGFHSPASRHHCQLGRIYAAVGEHVGRLCGRAGASHFASDSDRANKKKERKKKRKEKNKKKRKKEPPPSLSPSPYPRDQRRRDVSQRAFPPVVPKTPRWAVT